MKNLSRTAGKTIEEIELLFNDKAIKPWKTKPGDSLLDAKIAEVRETHRQNSIRASAMTDAEKGVLEAMHKDSGSDAEKRESVSKQ
jgi:hypothetical protein